MESRGGRKYSGLSGKKSFVPRINYEFYVSRVIRREGNMREKQEPQMMICPKAKECTEVCSAKTPHEFEKIGCTQRFNDVRDNCPSCIPYIPEYECIAPSRICMNDIDEELCEDCPDWQPKKLATCQEKERRINLTLVIKGDTISIE
jgi:hypothetical protein